MAWRFLNLCPVWSRIGRDCCKSWNGTGASIRIAAPYPLTTALLTAFAVFLCLAPHLYPALQQSWYSAYWALGFVVFRGVVVVVAAANLLLLRTYPAAWIHGLTLVILLGALFLWLLLAQLDATAHTAEFIVVPLLLTVACALALWRRCRPLGLGMSGLCLLVLCLGLLFPNADQAELSGKSLHNSVADQPVLSLADLGDESSLTGTGYETAGAFLARHTVYWEMSETASVSSEVYRCLTAGIAQAILADELGGGWTEIDGGWSKNDGRTVLLCDGRTVALLTWSESFDAQSLELAAANVF